MKNSAISGPSVGAQRDDDRRRCTGFAVVGRTSNEQLAVILTLAVERVVLELVPGSGQIGEGGGLNGQAGREGGMTRMRARGGGRAHFMMALPISSLSALRATTLSSVRDREEPRGSVPLVRVMARGRQDWLSMTE